MDTYSSYKFSKQVKVLPSTYICKNKALHKLSYCKSTINL